MPVAHCYNPDEVFACEEVILGLRKKKRTLGWLGNNALFPILPLLSLRDKRDYALSAVGIGSAAFHVGP